MDVIDLFVDGSCARNDNEIHAGNVIIKNNEIIAESYSCMTNIHTKINHYEEFAIITGLMLAQQIDNIKKVNLYSDNQSLVNVLNSKERKKTKLYNKKRLFIDSIISLQDFFLNSNIKLTINFIKDTQSFGMQRAHCISRKWNSKEAPIKPIILRETL